MKQTLENIMNTFPITTSEYEVLDKKFGKLAYYAAWELKRKNVQNSGTNEPEDDAQELRIALIRAGSYYKRQTYIEQCFETLGDHVEDEFTRKIVKELKKLWKDRRRHGANRQKFGLYQEVILDRLVQHNVPADLRPNRAATLQIDAKFHTYCKQIVWNAQKSLGKKITREKPLRTGMVSLSEFDHMGISL